MGGSSEVEVGEKKDRFVDALNSTRAAVSEASCQGAAALSCGRLGSSRCVLMRDTLYKLNYSGNIPSSH